MSGEVIGLHKLSQFEYVAAHVLDRETYVPVVVDAKRQKGDSIMHDIYCTVLVC